MTKLVYIGGYGHSGSTLLEYLMAGSPMVLSCGEVDSTIRERNNNSKEKRCSCGRAAADCTLWGFFHSSDSARRLTHAELLHTLIQRTDGKYAAIINSSKTAWGLFSAPVRLRRSFGSDFVLVHLMRQPAAVSWSVLKKKTPKGEARATRAVALHDTLQCDRRGLVDCQPELRVIRALLPQPICAASLRRSRPRSRGDLACAVRQGSSRRRVEVYR